MSEEAIQLTILGAGQSIGKSCFLLSVHQQHILLDCGSYVGKDTKKALPDFSKLPKNHFQNSSHLFLLLDYLSQQN